MDPAIPLPDEFCKGHVSRFLALNRHFRNEVQFLQFIRTARQYRSLVERPADMLEAIADACGMERTQYLQLHSMLAFTCFSEWADRDESDRGNWLYKQTQIVGRTSPRPVAYLCRRCVEEDLGFWGVSYWRRIHQIPGAHACAKHSLELLLAVTDMKSFSRPPADWLVAGKAAPQPEAGLLSSHPLVRRFVGLCESMLDGGRCWPASKVRAPLKQRAASLGLATSPRMSRKMTLLSDIAIEKMPPAFLTEVFPTMPNKQLGTFFLSIDSAVGAMPVRPTSLALAMTLLYEDNDQALAAWRLAGVFDPCRTKIFAVESAL
jgi:hypothetical protein